MVLTPFVRDVTGAKACGKIFEASMLFVRTPVSFFTSFAKMPQCIAYGCNNRSEDLSKGISFFRLPLKNPILLKTWVAKLRLQNPPIKETS